MTEASCRPARLIRFDETVQAMADGLYRRVGPLQDALDTYVATCDAPYVVDCRDATAAVSEWRGNFRVFGRWTGDVGRAFMAADAVDLYMGMDGETDVEAVFSSDEREVAGYLPQLWAGNPYLGIPPGTDEDDDPVAGDPIAGDQDGPPQWLDTLGHGGDIADISSDLLEGYAGLLANAPRTGTVTVRVINSTVEVLASGHVIATYRKLDVTARLIVPRPTGGITATARWLKRAGNVLQFVAAFGEQYAGDADLPDDERLLRAMTRGGWVLAGSVWGGAGGGAAAGLVCGPGAPVCSTVGAIAGGILGALLGDQITDLMPWMDNDDEPVPGEYDLDAMEDAVADPGEGDGPGDAALASVDLVASDIALHETDDDPALHAEVAALVPPREELLDLIEPEPPPPSPSPPTGTTIPPPTTTPTPNPQPGASPVPTTAPTAGPPTGTTTPAMIPTPSGAGAGGGGGAHVPR